MPENSATFSSEEINGFANKLEDWGTSLPHKERVLLQALLAAADDGGSEGEVSGFSFDSAKFQSPASLPKIDLTAIRVLGSLSQTSKPWALSAYDEWMPPD